MKMRVLLIVFVGTIVGCISNLNLLAEEHEREEPNRPDREREHRDHEIEAREHQEVRREIIHREQQEREEHRQNHFANMEREIQELHRLGNHKQAERLERRMVEERQAQFHPAPEDQGHRPDPDPARDIHELHRRLHHLNVAIENLRIAEFHEPAEALERQAHALREELERRAHEAHPEHEVGPGDHDGHRQGPEGRPGPGPELEEIHRNLREMRSQMEEFHRALRELHGRLEERSRR